MAQQYGEDWAATKCQAWEDNMQQDWMTKLHPCPCVYNQALTNYMWTPDPSCNASIPEQPCPYQPNAKMCFIPANSMYVNAV